MVRACVCHAGDLGFESRPQNLCGCREPYDYVKDSGSLHLIQSQEQHNTMPYMLELDLGPFPPDVVHFLPNDL